MKCPLHYVILYKSSYTLQYVVPVVVNYSFVLLIMGTESTRNMERDLAIKSRLCCILLDILCVYL
jgi:hypothetical protein